MQIEDIPEVTAIERQSFTTPWPPYAYRREIKENRNSRYLIIRWNDPEDGVEMEAESLSLPQTVEPRQPVTIEGTANEPSAVRRAVSRLLPFWRQTEGVRPARRRGVVVGYAGLWLIHDEAHITTIAVRPDLRGHGLGEFLLIRLMELAHEMGADRVTLEVRVSNQVAQNLYRKYTFTVEGVRRRYYSDDNEDGLIMTSSALSSTEFQHKFPALRAELYQRLGTPQGRPESA